jgi:hypothetical protein
MDGADLRPGASGREPLGRGSLRREQLDQLRPRMNLELAVGAAYVEINRLWAEEEPSADLLARQPVGRSIPG